MSPNGKIIVSIIDSNIFIKILNITSLEDQYNMHNSKVENHNTAFLPIYFDFDYGNEFSEMQRSFSILPPASKPDHRTLLLDLAIEKRPRYHQLQSESDCPYRLPKLDKLSPGIIDRGVHAYNSLVKY